MNNLELFIDGIQREDLTLRIDLNHGKKRRGLFKCFSEGDSWTISLLPPKDKTREFEMATRP